MNAMVRSRSTVMRLVRDAPGRRVSFMPGLLAHATPRILRARGASASHIVVPGGKGTKRHAWRPRQTALGSGSNLEEPRMQKRLCAAVLGLALWGVLVPGAAPGQTPGPSIKLIVPYPAGGLPDTVARVVGRRLQER